MPLGGVILIKEQMFTRTEPAATTVQVVHIRPSPSEAGGDIMHVSPNAIFVTETAVPAPP